MAKPKAKAKAVDPLAGLSSSTIREWFAHQFPHGPTPAQRLTWPIVAENEHVLLISPTGTGKTLAAFLAIVDRLVTEHQAGSLVPGLQCVYLSPLRSLGYDIERNLEQPLDAIRLRLGLEKSPIRVGVRTGDTSVHHRRKLRDQPPHILITTPESLSLLLSQSAWHPLWRGVRNVIVDEVHAMAPNKRGADLAISLERLAARAASDPARLGLSATCRPAEPVARFLTGPDRPCRIIDAPLPDGSPPIELEVECLIRSDESPHQGLTYRRLLRRLGTALRDHRTTVIFSNTRAFTEKITHDLRQTFDDEPERIAAHHSALDAVRRREVEASLKAGHLRVVVTSTSLELGVDIGTADLTVQIGLPGGVSRLLQRVGRAGHRVGVASRGLILGATPSELAGGVVTAQAAREGRVEPIKGVRGPLDVLCQQLVGMACEQEWSTGDAYALVRKSWPMGELSREDFDLCLAFLAGDLASPPGAYEPEPGSTPRWTSPRIWRRQGFFGIRSSRVVRWFWSNVGTISSEESVGVVVDGREVGSLEGAYAERLQAGDRFVLDGRCFEFRRLEGLAALVKVSSGEPNLPLWTSDRQTLTANLARELSSFRNEAGLRLADGPQALRAWLCEVHDLDPEAAAVLVNLFEAQERLSEIPQPSVLLVEESPDDQGTLYNFHAPLSRIACEALGRAFAARLGRKLNRDLSLVAADLGWSILVPDDLRLDRDDIVPLLTTENLENDVLEGLDRGELLARRFRHVAGTGLMVLRNPEGGRRRVGGLLWVSTRLYPLVKAACPHHPLLKETNREVLEDLLDTPSARAWLLESPGLRFRRLNGLSPFATAWIDPGKADPLKFDSPSDALKRLHARLASAGS